MEYISLNNGTKMPALGYGVFKVDPAECERCVTDAINAGYRMIDTAQFYANEEAVGNAIRKSGISRDEFFIVTKIWICNSGEARAEESFRESLLKLQTDYVDLLLVHQPFGDYYGTYRVMEKALAEGKTRAIGVSNFYADRFHDLTYHSDTVPAVDQLETNVFSQQTEMRKLLEKTGTKVMAWGPMAQAKENFFDHEVLKAIGAKYGKTASQVGLRFLVQQGIPAIPKTTDVKRMKENIDIFDFVLDEEDMTILMTLNLHDKGTRDYTDLTYASRIIAQKF
ncbi:MAG: aldo/keto reductase [Bacteroidales bacterium]|nr:aldo/keto reductase [Bacteroidales bacterium]